MCGKLAAPLLADQTSGALSPNLSTLNRAWYGSPSVEIHRAVDGPLRRLAGAKEQDRLQYRRIAHPLLWFAIVEDSPPEFFRRVWPPQPRRFHGRRLPLRRDELRSIDPKRPLRPRHRPGGLICPLQLLLPGDAGRDRPLRLLIPSIPMQHIRCPLRTESESPALVVLLRPA